MNQAPPIGDHAPCRWRTIAAIGWLSAFCVFYYSLTPPNNPELRRYEVWTQAPFVLLDAVDPPEEAGGPPSRWSYFPQRFDLLLTAAIVLAGAWGAGHLLLRMIRIPLEPRCLERTLFAFALGLAALSLLTLLCGLAGILSPVLFAAVILCVAFGEWTLRIRERKRISTTTYNRSAGETSDKNTVSPLAKFLLLAAMLPFLLAMLLGSLLPSTDFDVREYHLQGPKEFYQTGRIDFLPHNVYTSFPFLTEMLSLLAMVLRGDWYRGALAGKAVLMCFGPLTALALYVAGRRWFGPRAGWLAALIYISMPWTFRISTIAYAEGGLSFYLFASLLAFGIAVEKLREASAAANRLFLVCGLLAGCAMACKYTGVVSAVIPFFAAICVVCLRPSSTATGGGPQARRAVARSAAAFLLGASITIGPWLIKNLVETGNPVYPLMYTVFGGRDWDAELNAKWRAGHSPADYTDLPERLLEVTAANDWLTPLLFGLAPLSLLWLWCRHPACGSQPIDGSTTTGTGEETALEQSCLPGKRGRLPYVGYLWLYVLWLFATWWALTHRLDRFWVPMTPLVALLAGIGATAVWNRPWRVALRCWIAAALLFNLALVVSGASGNNAFLVDLRHAQHVPPGIAFLNAELPPRSRVLMLGEAQVFDARFPLVYNTVFDRSIFEQWFAAKPAGSVPRERPFRDTAEIRRKLRDEGITHVFVNWQEILRYRTTYGYTKFVTPARFEALVERGVLRPPTTLAVVRDDDLWRRVNAGQAPFQPERYNKADGDETIVYNVRREFSAAEARELQDWGQALLTKERERPLFVAGQVYEVRP